ncbi:BT4734/BF3469 family protein [Aquimarina sp. RZ0]|uniref:BT4734/BF3469 family protein n=1 Tax=Aquimarina sp. RZ0 TaxID=2607730 RepID=UPI0011F26382|nr:BT4734/BF3469 family protein [Aquimarina sp. RZ0]KAA1242589.1 VirE protein [Aquimarina sp. RZ0]
MITKETILGKTHYGLKIFAYILRQYYPKETELRVSGRECKSTYNPFASHYRKSLQITVVNNVAVYKDLENKDFQGDVFDFAQLYFRKDTEIELLLTINDSLHLNLETKLSTYELRQEDIQNFLDRIPDTEWESRFSYFSKNLYNLIPTKTIGLSEVYQMLTDISRKHPTEYLRKLSSEKKQKEYKKKHFDYVTFSGVFTKRNNSSLRTYSKLLTLDIDGIPTKQELIDIRKTLLKDPYFPAQLLFMSPRGNGLKWIIKISLAEVSHTQYFQAVINYIKETYNIQIDTSGSDVSRGCLLPYDPDTYIHPKCKADAKI